MSAELKNMYIDMLEEIKERAVNNIDEYESEKVELAYNTLLLFATKLTQESSLEMSELEEITNKKTECYKAVKRTEELNLLKFYKNLDDTRKRCFKELKEEEENAIQRRNYN